MKEIRWLVGIVMLAVVLSVGVGCGSVKLAPGGVYKGNAVLFQADRTIEGAYDTLDAFVNWEKTYRAALKDYPEVSKAAADVRANGKRWIDEAIAARDLYVALPNAEHQTKLELAIATLRAALDIARKYVPQSTEGGK